MVELTLFSGEADFQGATFNAPFAASDGEEAPGGGSRTKAALALGFLLGAGVVTGLVLAVRRLLSRGDDEPGPAVGEEEAEPTAAVDDSASPAVGAAAVAAAIGLAFLLAVTVLIKRRGDRSGEDDTAVTTGPGVETGTEIGA
jgi:hypothetical protein